MGQRIFGERVALSLERELNWAMYTRLEQHFLNPTKLRASISSCCKHVS